MFDVREAGQCHLEAHQGGTRTDMELIFQKILDTKGYAMSSK